jgi:hypothetical protein
MLQTDPKQSHVQLQPYLHIQLSTSLAYTATAGTHHLLCALAAAVPAAACSQLGTSACACSCAPGLLRAGPLPWQLLLLITQCCASPWPLLLQEAAADKRQACLPQPSHG